MITQEFKDQMREFLISAFDVRSSVLYSPYSLSNDMSFDEDLFMIRAPFSVGRELLNFFKEEGLCVRETNCGLYTISLTL
jgi:hypothetical protein